MSVNFPTFIGPMWWVLFTAGRSESGSAKSSSYPQLHLSVVSDSELAAVDQRGTVRILETGRASLERCGEVLTLGFSIEFWCSNLSKCNTGVGH